MKSVSVATLPEDAQAIISSITDSDSVYFVLKIFESNYVEHLRSYELVADCGGKVFVRSPYELHDSIPLTAYRVKGQKILATKRLISLLKLQ